MLSTVYSGAVCGVEIFQHRVLSLCLVTLNASRRAGKMNET